MEETRDVKENLGIVVRYTVKVRLSVAFGRFDIPIPCGVIAHLCISFFPLLFVSLSLSVCTLPSDLTLQLPFTLTHPKPLEPVISQMVTLPTRQSVISSGSGIQDGDVATPQDTGMCTARTSCVISCVTSCVTSCVISWVHSWLDRAGCSGFVYCCFIVH